MNPKSLAALSVGKIVQTILQLSGGGATTAPGYYSLKIDRTLLKTLSKDLAAIIIVTGTNGKTTTSRFISDILQSNNNRVIHNRAGSNLVRGITSTLIKHYPIKKRTIGLFEVDEATLPLVLEQVNPTILVINNLFRDQLDRYGEVATIFHKWQKAVAALPKETILVLNSDDPHVAALGRDTKADVTYFGLDDKKLSSKTPSHTIDARVCPFCGQPLSYDYYYSAHLGSYHCLKRDFRRPDPIIVAQNIDIKDLNRADFEISFHGITTKINLPLSGLYNIYNSLGAAAAAHELDISNSVIKAGLENFEAAFGRGQTLKIGEKKVSLNLVKNPVGYNEVIKLISSRKNIDLFLLLNDHLADGTDVSWIWDVDFESLRGKLKSLTVSGNRALDLANRLKYAELGIKTYIVPKIDAGFDKGVSLVTDQETLFVLPTYTAMLDLQKLLNKKGLIKNFWKN